MSSRRAPLFSSRLQHSQKSQRVSQRFPQQYTGRSGRSQGGQYTGRSLKSSAAGGLEVEQQSQQSRSTLGGLGMALKSWFNENDDKALLGVDSDGDDDDDLLGTDEDLAPGGWEGL